MKGKKLTKTAALLTIVIPTYNRAGSLEMLLKALADELMGLEGQACVIVSDNASTDRTSEVIAVFQSRCPSAVLFRHETNVGPDENFCRCIEKVKSDYFWFIGDDDIPKCGVVRHVLNLLRQELPDLIFLTGVPRDEITDNEPDDPVLKLVFHSPSQLEFAREVHVHLTFISAVVVNRKTYLKSSDNHSLRKYSGTNLVQLGWVLEVLKTGKRFLIVESPCLLATQNNSGGYAILRVFGQNFASIAARVFGQRSKLTHTMIRQNLIEHLPTVVWKYRFAKMGNYEIERPTMALRPQLGGYLIYWLLLFPIAAWPKPIASTFLQISRQIPRILRLKKKVGRLLTGDKLA